MHLLAAAHNGQLAVLGARLTAGNRRVDKTDSLFRQSRGDLARDIGRRGGVVDKDRALRHAVDRAIGTGDHVAHTGIVADASQDNLLALGCLGRRRGGAAAVLGHPGLRFFGIAVINRDVMAFGGQVAGHGVAHDPQAQKRNFHEAISLEALRQRMNG